MALVIGEVRRENAGVRKLVACSCCSGLFEISPRQLRSQRAKGALPVCRTCRRPTAEVDEAAIAYWEDRMARGLITFERIVEIAEMMHGPRQRWPEWQALHLRSAEPEPPRLRLVFTRVTTYREKLVA